MVTEFLRGGFSSGFAASGEPFSRFYYTASINTNLSQLGVTTNEDDRDVAYSYVVTNAAGRGSAKKEYGYLLGGARGAAFARKVRDVHELLAEHDARAERHALHLTIAWHDACHLAHAQAVRAQLRALLRSIFELKLVEPAEWEMCCGSAGIYNLTQPEAATKPGERKAENLPATGAQAIAAANPG